MENNIAIKALRRLIREELIKLVKEDRKAAQAPPKAGRGMKDIMTEGLIGSRPTRKTPKRRTVKR